MGYTTEFEGEFKLSRVLTFKEYKTLMDLHETRHGGNIHSDPKFPGFYCQWVPGEDGDTIHWDGGEKFYEYVGWMNHLLEKFLTPWGIVVSGKVRYQGESVGDHGALIIRDGRCVVVPDSDVGDVSERLEEYIEELNKFPNDDVPVAAVTDRLSAILYGDPS